MTTHDSDLDADVKAFWPACPARILDLLGSIRSERSETLVRRAEKRTTKHYGHYSIIESTSDWALSLAVLQPKRSMSRHIHRVRRELVYVRFGVLSMGLADDVRRVEVGHSIASVNGIPHQVANDEDDVLEIIELVVPPQWEDKVVLAAGR
jgi:mannose-6-phosphate isomerase-like protein (cupin superfamily)